MYNLPLMLILAQQSSPLYQAFENFTEASLSSESLQFWNSVNGFREQNVSQLSAESIYFTYLVDDAPKWICVPHQMLQDVLTIIESGNQVTSDIFDEIQTCVYNDMQRNTLGRFLDTIAAGRDPRLHAAQNQLQKLIENEEHTREGLYSIPSQQEL